MRNLPYWLENIADYVENIGFAPLCGDYKRIRNPLTSNL